MVKLNLLFIATSLAIACVASLRIQSRAQAKSRQNDIELREQVRQLAELTGENQRLSSLLARAETNSAAAGDCTDELAKLRAHVLTLREQTNLLAKQLAQKRRSAAAQMQSNLREHNHIVFGTFGGGPRATGKLNDARALTDALRVYANKHEGEFPMNLDQVALYLPKPSYPDADPEANAPLTGTNDFELVYQGSRKELSNIPPHMVVLIRERQPWLTPDGKWARVYGYADGAADTIESDDDFQSWEAQHVIPPPLK
jgi:hypothetical protein